MDDREVVLITGVCVAVVLLIAFAVLIGGSDMEEYADWNTGFALSNERASWEANI